MVSTCNPFAFASYYGDVAQYESVDAACCDILPDPRGLTYYVCEVCPLHSLKVGDFYFEIGDWNKHVYHGKDFVPRFVVKIHKIVNVL